MLASGTSTPATAPISTAAGRADARRAGGDRDEPAEEAEQASVTSGLP